MRTQSVDPNVRRYDPADETPCPECRSWMLPLDRYEVQSSESPSLEASGTDVYLWGLWAYVFNYVYDLFTMKGRQAKLAALKRDILPEFPNSLVCPRCLTVKKRK